MAVITISRQFGAGGAVIGERLAKKLNYRYLHDELDKEVARKTGVPADQVAAVEKESGSKLMKMLDWVLSPDFVEQHASEQGYLTEKRYVEEIKRITLGIYEKGNALIIGRGANFTLRGYPDTVHVLLVAGLEHRLNYVAGKYSLTRSEAERAIRQADMIRQRFLNCFSEQDSHDDPLLYTVSLNMSYISIDQAEALVYELTKK